MAVGDVRPFIDSVALATKGRTTTYQDGSVRATVDTMALATKGRVTLYIAGEEGGDDVPGGRIVLVRNDSRLVLTHDDSRLKMIHNDKRLVFKANIG